MNRKKRRTKIEPFTIEINQREYPFLLDASLKEAMKLAMDAEDDETLKALWQIFVSYRRTEGRIIKEKEL